MSTFIVAVIVTVIITTLIGSIVLICCPSKRSIQHIVDQAWDEHIIDQAWDEKYVAAQALLFGAEGPILLSEVHIKIILSWVRFALTYGTEPNITTMYLKYFNTLPPEGFGSPDHKEEEFLAFPSTNIVNQFGSEH